MNEVKVCVITGFGINADVELETAFKEVGAKAQRWHITDLIQQPTLLNDFHIVAFPGGFSYGDHIGSGKVFAGLFKKSLKNALNRFVAVGKLVIGICNGFQVLVKMGILPNLNDNWDPEVSLIHNDSGKFEDRWVKVYFNPHSPCVWTKGLDPIELPVRHGEGKFITQSEKILQTLIQKNLVAIQYMTRSELGKPFAEKTADKSPTERARELVPYPFNPNGSFYNVAGICDPSGRVLGLMPHPEAFLYPENHPRWTSELVKNGDGLQIFQKGVKYIRENLL